MVCKDSVFGSRTPWILLIPYSRYTSLDSSVFCMSCQCGGWNYKYDQTQMQLLWWHLQEWSFIRKHTCVGPSVVWAIVSTQCLDLFTYLDGLNSNLDYFSFIDQMQYFYKNLLPLIYFLVTQWHSSYRRNKINIWFFSFIYHVSK